jgi:hypothetical protein
MDLFVIIMGLILTAIFVVISLRIKLISNQIRISQKKEVSKEMELLTLKDKLEVDRLLGEVELLVKKIESEKQVYKKQRSLLLTTYIVFLVKIVSSLASHLMEMMHFDDRDRKKL